MWQHLWPSRPLKTGRPTHPGSEAAFPEVGELMAANVLLSKVESTPFALPRLPENASVGRRWKFRRNLVIYIASRNGASQRLLADVFDLPHSRIAAIIKEFRAKYAD